MAHPPPSTGPPALPDPKKLFNAGLEGGTRRAVDIREGEKVDERAFKALVKARWPGMPRA